MIHRGIIIFIMIPLLTYAQYQRPGSTDAQFLKIGVSPRGTAMGDAYISVVEGAEATYYNAAELPWIKGTDIVFNHNFWFAGINHDFVAATHSFEELGTFGLSVTALYTDEMKVRTPLQPDGTGETFYAGNYRFGLSYARFFTDRVTIGATISYINLSLYKDFKADAVSVDIATMYTSDFRGFKFAMAITNFGSNVKFVNESYPLPTAFTFGASINAIENENQKVILSFSALKPNDGKPLSQVGIEWNFHNQFFARGGYKINYDVATFTFGGGVKFSISNINTRFDYSYSSFGLLGVAHRIGIGINLE
ncbi:PorV/PorQ family protein [Melioribacteraceae bacterium 4301-Me]|uniref:PorV/PorQ family protein n=1 Tax=Pyranulibacter aquaticus TaxID=3163344 RepID=UPI00359B35DE